MLGIVSVTFLRYGGKHVTCCFWGQFILHQSVFSGDIWNLDPRHPSAGLRHKLSKLQLRAPGYPKGPPCIQRGPQKEKKKKRNKRKKKERKEKLKSENRSKIAPTTPLEFTNFIDYPPSKSGRKIAPTTPLEFTNFIDYPPSKYRAGKSL